MFNVLEMTGLVVAVLIWVSAILGLIVLIGNLIQMTIDVWKEFRNG